MENKPKISLQSSTLVLLVILAMVAGIVGGLGGNYLITILQERGGQGGTAFGGASASRSSGRNVSSGRMPASFADVAAVVIPSVVNIETVSENTASKEADMLRRLLPFAAPVPREREGIGSGVIIRSNGIVLTNEHVIKGAQKIQVTLTDGRKFSGHVIGRDPELDIAVVKINASDLPSAKLGNSNELRPGDWALAVGSPLGLSSSVTLGVVSALNRPIHVEDRSYTDLIQTDTAISPGNSGGPLVNAAGEIVGLNTAMQIDMQRATLGAAAARIGFSVPIDTIKEVLDQLVRSGKVVRPWVGISMRLITDDYAKRWELPVKEGIAIGDVLKGGPADRAGLYARDIILKVDGQAVKKMEQIQKLVRRHRVGEEVVFEVNRESANGKWRIREVKVKTAEMPQELPQPPEEK